MEKLTDWLLCLFLPTAITQMRTKIGRAINHKRVRLDLLLMSIAFHF